MDKRKSIYYTDEVNDEFSVTKLTPKKIDKNYIYAHDSKWKKVTHFFWYRVIALPLAFLYTKFKFGHKKMNEDVIEGYIHTGYFLYGNHTQDIADALIPNMIDKKRDKYIIVHPNNLSVPVVGHITPSLGAIPIPGDISSQREFMKTIDRRIKEKCAVVIYPEAHIWPYYTGIRNFSDDSFYYPVKYRVPTFCFTNTYKKRFARKEPKIVTYIDGPFFPKLSLDKKAQRKDLRDRVYECMKKRSELSNIEVIKYIKKEENLNG